MKISIIGSTGGTGRALVEQLLAAGHEVTAFSRRASAMGIASDKLRTIDGDAMSADDVERAVAGQDAVVVTLGIRENPLRVRLFGPARTPIDVRSQGTRHVIAAMRKHGVRRLVVQTTYGVGETRERLRLVDRMFFRLLLEPQIADTEVQNREVTECDLDWVIAQPVHLTDGADEGMPFVSMDGATGRMKVSRHAVARFLASAATGAGFVRRTVAVSGAMVA